MWTILESPYENALNAMSDRVFTHIVMTKSRVSEKIVQMFSELDACRLPIVSISRSEEQIWFNAIRQASFLSDFISSIQVHPYIHVFIKCLKSSAYRVRIRLFIVMVAERRVAVGA